MAMLEPKLTWQTATSFLVLWIIYQFLKAVYRVTFHPLASFPGRKLAALTYYYEGYFDVIQVGQYTTEIARMHEEYGPIVRINPDELHCNDPNFIDQIYPSGGERRDKWSFYLAQLGPIAMSSAATEHHNLHRIRRTALNRYFSKASITRLEPLIHGLVQHLCDKLLTRSKDGKPAFDVTMAYSCFTSDVITHYCFEQSYGLLDQDGFEPNLRPAVQVVLKSGPLIKQWPTLGWILDKIPDAVVRHFSADLAVFVDTQQRARQHVKLTKDAYADGKVKESPGHMGMVAELLESNLPENEKALERLSAETSSLIGAGTETVAWTLAVATYHLLSQSAIRSRLTAELEKAVKDPKNLPSWTVCEQIPYLISISHYILAIILESIRLSYGVATRLARISPDKALIYESSSKEKLFKYVIPKGTPIGMTSVIMHANETIFPQAESFIPERWLKKDGTKRTDLERYLMSFSKGSRQCLGMNLAYCELYIAIAALVLRVLPHMELFETTIEDVKFHHDLFLPMAHPKSLGVRVLIE